MNSSSSIRIIVLSLFTGLFSTMNAQDLEYKMELGGMLGGSFYYGDTNFTAMFKNTNMMGGAIWRYNFNSRMALKANFAIAGISGSTKDFEYKIPGEDEIDFSRTIYDLGTQFEYNFFAYGDDKAGYRRTKRLTPYIFAGMGFTFAPKPLDNVFTVNFPIGVGVKYKIAHRLNLGCEFSVRFSLSDKLDVAKNTNITLDDPLGIPSSWSKNKDSYSFLLFFLSYDISPKYRKCNN